MSRAPSRNTGVKCSVTCGTILRVAAGHAGTVPLKMPPVAVLPVANHDSSGAYPSRCSSLAVPAGLAARSSADRPVLRGSTSQTAWACLPQSVTLAGVSRLHSGASSMYFCRHSAGVPRNVDTPWLPAKRGPVGRRPMLGPDSSSYGRTLTQTGPVLLSSPSTFTTLRQCPLPARLSGGTCRPLPESCQMTARPACCAACTPWRNASPRLSAKDSRWTFPSCLSSARLRFLTTRSKKSSTNESRCCCTKLALGMCSSSSEALAAAELLTAPLAQAGTCDACAPASPARNQPPACAFLAARET